MRVPIIAGNWKMNKTVAEARELTLALRDELEVVGGVEKVLCPPFVDLQAVAELIQGTSLGLGAQNMYWEVKGAYTGESVAGDAPGLCQYVILGHSERRQLLRRDGRGGEPQGAGGAGARAGADHLLRGEPGAERARGDGAVRGRAGARGVCRADGGAGAGLRGGVRADLGDWHGEGGDGRGSERDHRPGGAQTLAELYGADVADAIRIQYGGSVTPANIANTWGNRTSTGALVGGASLKAGDFIGIVRGTAQ